MFCFIKSRKDYTTKAISLVLDYEIKESVYDVVSTIVIQKTDVIPSTGDIIYCDDGFIGILKSYSINNDSVSMTINQIVTMFDREIFFKKASYEYLEDRMVQLINYYYTNCEDEVYRVPYLDVKTGSHSAEQLSPDLEDGIFNIKSYSAKMRRLNRIVLDWHPHRDTLEVIVTKYPEYLRTVDLKDPNYLITEEKYSELSVAKITSYCVETNEYKDWYLDSEGKVQEEIPTNRANGEWIALTIENKDDVVDTVKDEFKKNTYSHSIVFSAPIDAKLGFYDSVKVWKDGEVFDSYISGITYSKDSNRKTITLGELQTSYPYSNLI